MADEAPPASGDGGPGGTRRKRPAPTIDLKATEVASEPAPTTAQAASDAVPTAAPKEAAPDAPELAKDAQPKAEPESTAAPDEQAAPPRRPAIAWLPPDLPWRAFGAGAAGGVGVAALLLLLWLAMPVRDPTAGLASRLDGIETRLREIAARPAPAGVDPKAVESLSARLGKLESAAKTSPAADPALAGRVGALENQLKSMSGNLVAVTQRAEKSAVALGQLQDAARTSSADHTQVETLSGRVAALEKTDRAVAEELAKRATAAGADRSLRLAVAAAALRATVERNEPFAAELAATKPLAADAVMLAPLEPFAATGVPSAGTLGRELAVLIQPMIKLTGSPSRDGGIIDRLQANAEKLVRVRPVDETPGDSPVAILSRAEIRAAHGDIPATLAELAKLPERVRAPAKAWMARAEARGQALEASRRLAVESVTALKQGP